MGDDTLCPWCGAYRAAELAALRERLTKTEGDLAAAYVEIDRAERVIGAFKDMITARDVTIAELRAALAEARTIIEEKAEEERYRHAHREYYGDQDDTYRSMLTRIDAALRETEPK